MPDTVPPFTWAIRGGRSRSDPGPETGDTLDTLDEAMEHGWVVAVTSATRAPSRLRDAMRKRALQHDRLLHWKADGRDPGTWWAWWSSAKP